VQAGDYAGHDRGRSAAAERLIARLALLAGMRPGEIFGLKWARMEAEYADIRQRVYRGDIDSPKSVRSVRHAALSDGLLISIDDWRAVSLDTSADAWVFPSEKLKTPVAKGQLLETVFLVKTQADRIGLGELPGHAPHSQFAIEGAGCRSAYSG
jgi:integrase